jgi:hypothetical protein
MGRSSFRSAWFFGHDVVVDYRGRRVSSDGSTRLTRNDWYPASWILYGYPEHARLASPTHALKAVSESRRELRPHLAQRGKDD